MAKSITLKILALFLGCLLAFFVGEITLRQLGYAASDIYTQGRSGLLVLNPDKKIQINGGCFQNEVKTNSLGFHSKEYSPEKSDGVFRIAVIGDSFVEAVQVPLERTISSLLEQKLNSINGRKYNYEVIPFGISSHGTYRNLLYYENYGVEFKPDLVIDSLAWNDIEDDAWETGINFDGNGWLIGGGITTEPETMSKQVKKVLRKSVLITTLRKKYKEFVAKSKSSTKTSAGVTILSPEPDEFWSKAWDRQNKLLKNFKMEIADNGSNFLLVSLSDGYRVHNDLKRAFTATAQTDDLDFDKPEKALGQIAQDAGISYLALNPLFKERAQTDDELTVWSCDGHWNETGHEWAAEALFEYLKNENLLPDK